MKFKLLMTTATAASVLMAGGAMAGSGNTLYISQSGGSNTTLVDQAGGSNNNIGSEATPALQQGNNNRLWFDVGSSVNLNNDNNDVEKFYQVGNGNFFHGIAGGSDGVNGDSYNNVLKYFRQQGDNNGAYAYWTRASGSTIDQVWIEGNNNPITIVQGDWSSHSSNNAIGNVWITGSNNGIGNASTGWLHASTSAATYIQQIGNGNKITDSQIWGSNNRDADPYATGAYNRVHAIVQTGNNNGLASSVAITNGSNGNWIKVTENGDWNNFYVVQGANTLSTHNYATLNQQGSSNDGHITEVGSYNQVNAQQLGDSNRAYVNITGDSNGIGSFINGVNDMAGKGGLQVAMANGLSSGDVLQYTDHNLTDISITSNLNNFAVLQKTGDWNEVSGSISGGDSNQLVAVQNGASNVTSFTIVGSLNSTVVNQ